MRSSLTASVVSSSAYTNFVLDRRIRPAAATSDATLVRSIGATAAPQNLACSPSRFILRNVQVVLTAAITATTIVMWSTFPFRR